MLSGSHVLPHEDDAEMAIGDLARVADEEVGGDQAAGPGELPLAVLDAPPPENVARLVARILTKRRPRLRYRVGSDVIGSFWTKRFLPASLYERLVRSYYKLLDRPDPVPEALPEHDPQNA